MEKHWKSVVSRSVCDYFFEQQRKINNPEDIPPIISTPHHYLISIYKNSMFFVAVCMTEGKHFCQFYCCTVDISLVFKTVTVAVHFLSAPIICHRISASSCRNI